MAEIPAEIMERARELWHGEIMLFGEPVEAIATALMAERDIERQRCLMVRPEPDIEADEYTAPPYNAGYVVGFWDCYSRIMSAIKTPEEGTTERRAGLKAGKDVG